MPQPVVFSSIKHKSILKTIAFADEDSSNTDTDKIMAQMDAQYREEEAKFMKTFLAKNHQALIQNLETKFDTLADKQSGRPSGSLPSNTQPNPKGYNSKSYNPPVNPNDQQDNSKTTINFDSDDEDEPTPQPKIQTQKTAKETLLPKPYKPKISYPQRLTKKKMEAWNG
ncbi:hypothetical protein Tco_1325039 [Tanacetum coccineum]